MVSLIGTISNELEINKLRAEAAKLQAETEERVENANKLKAEAAKLQAETEERVENANKLRADLARTKETRILEWIKGLGALLIGIAALFTFGLTAHNTSLQRQEDARKRQDAEFASTVEKVSASEPSTRLSNIVSLSRFVRSGYEDYLTRALPVLVARLRFEPDFGTRRLIQQIAIEVGTAAKPALLAVRQDTRLELLSPLEETLAGPPKPRRILQQAFFDASRAIAEIDRKPLDLSTGPLDDFPIPVRRLSDANLDGASLRKVDLSEVNLERASLNNTVLRLALLRQANLSGADLKDADFTCADIKGASFTNIRNFTPDQFAYTNWRDAGFNTTEWNALNTRYPEPDGSSAEFIRYCKNVVK